MCEVFNGKLADGRDKPIIGTLEYIREYLMRRIMTVNKVIASSNGPLTPTAEKLFDHIKKEASKYTVQWNGGIHYQVTSPWGDQCVVDVVEKTCSCRKWELTGLPCKHAVAANWNMVQNRQETGLPETWVHPCYRLETWKQVYSYKIMPIRGPKMWPRCDVPSTIIPPVHKSQPGRPRKQRTKSALEKSESMVKNNKLSRKGRTVTCDKCGCPGHNSRSCTGPRVEKTKKRKSNVAGGSNAAGVAAGSNAAGVAAGSNAAGVAAGASGSNAAGASQRSEPSVPAGASGSKVNKGKGIAVDVPGSKKKKPGRKVIKLG